MGKKDSGCLSPLLGHTVVPGTTVLSLPNESSQVSSLPPPNQSRPLGKPAAAAEANRRTMCTPRAASQCTYATRTGAASHLATHSTPSLQREGGPFALVGGRLSTRAGRGQDPSQHSADPRIISRSAVRAGGEVRRRRAADGRHGGSHGGGGGVLCQAGCVWTVRMRMPIPG